MRNRLSPTRNATCTRGVPSGRVTTPDTVPVAITLHWRRGSTLPPAHGPPQLCLLAIPGRGRPCVFRLTAATSASPSTATSTDAPLPRPPLPAHRCRPHRRCFRSLSLPLTLPLPPALPPPPLPPPLPPPPLPMPPIRLAGGPRPPSAGRAFSQPLHNGRGQGGGGEAGRVAGGG